MTKFKTLTEDAKRELNRRVTDLTNYIGSCEARIENAQNEIRYAIKDLEKAAKKNDFDRTKFLAHRITQQHKHIEQALTHIEETKGHIEEAQRKLAGFGPILEYLEEVFQKDMEWHKEISGKIAGLSGKEAFVVCEKNQTIFMLANMDEEEAKKVFKADLNTRYLKLKKQIESVVGNVIEFDLRRNENISMDGFVLGDQGKASISTFGAGGFNIQRFHYRTKIKKVSFAEAK